jgi:hypothetical protein
MFFKEKITARNILWFFAILFFILQVFALIWDLFLKELIKGK